MPPIMTYDQIISLAMQVRTAQKAFFESREADKLENKDKTGFARMRSSKHSNQLLKISKDLEKEIDEALATYTPKKYKLDHRDIIIHADRYPTMGDTKHTIIIGPAASGNRIAKAIAGKYKNPQYMNYHVYGYELNDIMRKTDLIIFEDVYDKDMGYCVQSLEHKQITIIEADFEGDIELPRVIITTQHTYTENEIQVFRKYAEVYVLRNYREVG
jgi:hypothetical protein